MLFKSTAVVLMSSFALSTLAAPAEARIQRNRKSRSAAVSAQPLVFRSTGSGVAMGKVKHRDRTVTFLRQGGAVKVWIKDNLASNVVTGTLALGPERELLTDDPELANAANILAITPAVLEDLRSAGGNVITEGQVEANGTVFQVDLEHELRANQPDGGATILTRTRSTDGKLRLETLSRVDRNGVPLTASTRGKLKVFLFNADIQLSLQRVSGTGI